MFGVLLLIPEVDIYFSNLTFRVKSFFLTLREKNCWFLLLLVFAVVIVFNLFLFVWVDFFLALVLLDVLNIVTVPKRFLQ